MTTNREEDDMDQGVREIEEAALRALEAEESDDEAEDEDDELLNEIDRTAQHLRETGDFASYGKILAALYIGRGVAIIGKVLHQRLSVGQ